MNTFIKIFCLKLYLEKVILAMFSQGLPHPPSLLMADAWTKPNSREYAAFPASWLKIAKSWPSIGVFNKLYDKIIMHIPIFFM